MGIEAHARFDVWAAERSRGRAGNLVNEADCIAFLQWALPQIELRWPGFRKVRRQVCKRLRSRMSELRIAGFAEYRARLEADPAEWHVLDECCHITISRFFRDRGVFEVVRSRVLPDIAARAKRKGRTAQIWSAGCASNEEPYTLKILWDNEVARSYPGVPTRALPSLILRYLCNRQLRHVSRIGSCSTVF